MATSTASVTTDTTNYTRIHLILMKGGTLLTKTLFLKRVKDLSPAGHEFTVDEFLGKHRVQILSTSTGRNNEEKLYPPTGTSTNLDEWDLPLYCSILKTVCGLPNINKLDMEILKTMRNELAHLHDPSLTDADFKSHLITIEPIFARSFHMINDPSFEKELKALLQKCETGALVVDEVVKVHHDSNRKHIELLSNQVKMMKTQVDMIKNQSVMLQNQTTHQEKIDSALSMLTEIKDRLPPNPDVDIPDVHVIIEVKNCTKEKEKELLDFLVKQFDETISDPECTLNKDFPNLAMYTISEAICKTFQSFLEKGRHLLKVENGSICLTVKCNSISSFVGLIRDYIDGKLLDHLTDLKDAIQKWDGFSYIDFDLIVSPDEITEAILKLAKNLDEIVPKGIQVNVPPDELSSSTMFDPSTSKEDTLTSCSTSSIFRLEIKPETDDQRTEIEKCFSSGSISERFEQCQRQLRKDPHFTNVEIEAKLLAVDSPRTVCFKGTYRSKRMLFKENGSTAKESNEETEPRMDEEHRKVPTYDHDTPKPTNNSNGFSFAQTELLGPTDITISNFVLDSQEKELLYSALSQSQDVIAPYVKSSTLEQDRLWIKCIALNKKAYGYRAIRNNILPSRQMLDDLIDHFGRKSKFVLNICDKICTVMKSSSEQIVDVWPAMRAKDMQVTFIVIVKDEIDSVRLRAFTEYYFVKRRLDEVSSEGKGVIYSKQFDIGLAKITQEDSENITRSINLMNKELMRKHTQLTMISSSPVRSKGYNTGSHTIDAEPCIVLYVSLKGYFPIQEDHFDSHYHGLSVDVREGLAYLFTEYADSYHSHLKNGCQITKNRVGTLGGFLDFYGFGTCGLTSAHVLLDAEEMRNLAQGNGSKDWRIPTSDQMVFQPNNDLSEQSREERDHSAGKLVKAIYKEGGGGESGLDIAVFQVEKRFPVSGCFPTPRAGSYLDLSFDSGKTAGFSRLKFGGVTKFGASTDFTRGTVSMDAPNLSVKATYENIELFKDFKITMHNMIEVKSADISPTGELLPFAQPGDSGALVFCKCEEDELFCVGIVEGGTSSGTCFVIPIAPVLDELKLSGLKSFEKQRIFEHINALRTEIRQGQQNMSFAFQNIDQKLDLMFRSVSDRLHY